MTKTKVSSHVLEGHYQKVSRVGLIVLLAHLPLFYFVASFFETQKFVALVFPFLFITPLLMNYYFRPKSVTNMYLLAIAVMGFSGILIHLGKGMIEMHFHVFVFLGVLAITASTLAPIIAAATIAIHHVGFFFLFPSSLFNYEASFAIVAVHAAFVVVETALIVYLNQIMKSSLLKSQLVFSDVTPIQESLGVSQEQLHQATKTVIQDLNTMMRSVESTAEASHEIKKLGEIGNSVLSDFSRILDHASSQITDSEKVIKLSLEQTKDLSLAFVNFLSWLEVFQKKSKNFNEILNSVSDKTAVINDIVFQTKLLSFNASVEAARAGEHGKGFSVVAEDIGALAQNSGNAAVEIKQIVEQSLSSSDEMQTSLAQEVDGLQKMIKEMTSKISNSHELSEKSFSKIVKMNSELESAATGLIQNYKEQILGISHIDKSITDIRDLTNANVEKANENLQVANNIKSCSSKLDHFIEQFVDEKKIA